MTALNKVAHRVPAWSAGDRTQNETTKDYDEIDATNPQTTPRCEGKRKYKKETHHEKVQGNTCTQTIQRNTEF